MDRRDVLKRGGLVVGAGLTAPTVVSMAVSPAYGQNSSALTCTGGASVQIDDFSDTTAPTAPNIFAGGTRGLIGSASITPGQLAMSPGSRIFYGAVFSTPFDQSALPDLTTCSVVCFVGAPAGLVGSVSQPGGIIGRATDASGCISLAGFGPGGAQLVGVGLDAGAASFTVTSVEFR